AAGAACGEAPLAATTDDFGPDEALVWARHAGGEPVRVRIAPPRGERRRHRRKYAAGELGPDQSFYFRGPEGKLNLRAQNLALFAQIAAGVDDETWQHHLRRGDYSGWFRNVIKDQDLADEAARIEAGDGLDPADSRAGIRE